MVSLHSDDAALRAVRDVLDDLYEGRVPADDDESVLQVRFCCMCVFVVCACLLCVRVFALLCSHSAYRVSCLSRLSFFCLLLQYTVRRGVPWRAIGVIDSLVAKTYATAPDALSAAAMAEEAAESTAGAGNYRLATGYGPLLDMLRPGVRVLTTWQATRIDTNAAGGAVVVTSARGDV